MMSDLLETKGRSVPNQKQHSQVVSHRRRSTIAAVVTAIVLITFATAVAIILVPVDETPIGHNHDDNDDDNNNNNRRVMEVVTSSTRTQRGTYSLLQTVPHDSQAFTQGLMTVYDPHDDTLKFYEGTGIKGQSQLRLVQIDTGTVLAQHSLPYRYFGEGITVYLDDGDNINSRLRLIQITWQEETAFDYDLQNTTITTTNRTRYSDWLIKMKNAIRSSRFCRRRIRRLQLCRNSTVNVTEDAVVEFSGPLGVTEPTSTIQYNTTTKEGWGITYARSNHRLYVTDGSHYLHTWNVTTKQEIAKVPVTYQYSNMDAPVNMNRLNEIEYDPVTNTILANVWLTNMIVRIDIATGFIVTIYDLSTLYTNRAAGADVLNGIALTYDALQQQQPRNVNRTDQVWVTGKFWPNMYRIQLIDP